MGKWYDTAAFYHIYPLGLLGAPKTNTEEGVVHRMEELMDWVPHIEKLGCNALYIGPLFESTTHGYDTKDYKKVDRRLGDNQDFIAFVKLCHEHGIKVVVDGVFNHTGREFFAFQDVLKNREASPYCSWIKGLNLGGNDPYNDGLWYEAWRNCFELVNLNYWERGVKDYILDVIRFWIREFDIDGIRLDCADCLQFDFMKEMKWVTSQEKEDFWLMGELIHGDYSRWVNPEMLNSSTNYELAKGLYSGHNDHNYFEIAHSIRRQFGESGGIYKGLHLYNFVDNHDVDRIVSKLNNQAHLPLVYTLLYTLQGIPSIYYGSEWGVSGKKEGGNDDPLRPRLSLKELEKNPPNKEIYEYICQLGKLYQETDLFAEGDYKELLLTNRQYAFSREKDGKGYLVICNNDENPTEVFVRFSMAVQSLQDVFTKEKIAFADGGVSCKLNACQSMILSFNMEK